MTLPEILEFVLRLIDVLIIPLIFALAFVAFLWGIYQSFIAGGADEERRAKGRQIMMFGIIGFVIMFSVWSLVSLVRASLGFGNEARPAFPVFQGQNTSSQNAIRRGYNSNTDGNRAVPAPAVNVPVNSASEPSPNDVNPY